MHSRYYYGMRLRGFSIGCQPMDGLIGTVDMGNLRDKTPYHDVLSYSRPLTQTEMEDYELDYLYEAEEGE
jgi:hypothetical protein